MLALLLVAMIMQVFEGSFFAWHIPADLRPFVAATVVVAYAVLELCATFADHRALSTAVDSRGRTVVLRGSQGLGILERDSPFSVIAGVEIVNRPTYCWWPSDRKYVLQARLIAGEV